MKQKHLKLVTLCFLVLSFVRATSASKSVSSSTLSLPNITTDDTTFGDIDGTTFTIGPTMENATTDSSTCDTDPSPCPDPSTWCNETDTVIQCPCIPGFYMATESGSCTLALVFGGILYVQDDGSYVDEPTIEALLTSAYTSNDFLVSASVVPNNRTEWSYQVLFQPQSHYQSSDVQHMFNSYTDNSCFNGICSVSSSGSDSDSGSGSGNGIDIHINVNRSIQDAGTVGSVVCESSNFTGYCDSSSSACSSTDGYVQCSCLIDFVSLPKNNRQCLAVLCKTDDECNSPFGSCDPSGNNGAGTCSCTFGVEGATCHSPWLLVFVIFACSVGGIAIITIIVCFVFRRRHSKRLEFEAGLWNLDSDADHDDNQASFGFAIPRRMRANLPGGVARFYSFAQDD